jgi:hypothetical protein
MSPTGNTLQELATKMADRLMSAEDVLNLPPPEWLVEDVLPADALGVLFGRPGTKKSFLALDLALCVANGLPFLNDHPTKQGRVIYVAAEGRAGMSIRLEAWMTAFGVPEVPDFFLYPQAVPLTDDRYGPAFVEMCRLLKPKLVVIDTLARSMGSADENSTRDMSALMNTIDAVRNATGAMVLLVHHTTKGGEQYRGNSSLEGAMDTMLQMTEEEATEILKLSCFKQKEGVESLVKWMTLEVVPVRGGLTTSCVLHPQSAMKMKAGQETKDLHVLGFIFNSPHGEEFTAKQLAEVTGIDYGNIHRTLNGLVEQEFLTARKSGRSNVYTMTRAQRAQVILTHPHLSSSDGPPSSSSSSPPGAGKPRGEDEDKGGGKGEDDDDGGAKISAECP